jgi:hypothetical protein
LGLEKRMEEPPAEFVELLMFVAIQWAVLRDDSVFVLEEGEEYNLAVDLAVLSRAQSRHLTVCYRLMVLFAGEVVAVDLHVARMIQESAT